MTRPTRSSLFVASLVMVATFAACHHRNIAPLPCKDVSNASCGTKCTTDANCGAGLYCDTTTSMCAAQCVAGGTSCGSGETCDIADGRCIATSGGGDASMVTCPA